MKYTFFTLTLVLRAHNPVSWLKESAGHNIGSKPWDKSGKSDPSVRRGLHLNQLNQYSRLKLTKVSEIWWEDVIKKKKAGHSLEGWAGVGVYPTSRQ